MSELINSTSEWGNSHIHFVGIGGSGMSGIARIFNARGAQVTGSDIQDSASLSGLRSLGIKVFVGHEATNVSGANLVVRSSAIPDSNVEIQMAKSQGIQVLERAQALALLLVGSRSIAVAGTHGKTTTTSMLTVALQHCGFDPSFSIGATIRNSGTNAHQGSGDVFVVEADESDGSFVAYKPLGAIITNIELDHVDNFADISDIDQIFAEFVKSVQPEGFLIVCGDDPGVKRLLSKSGAIPQEVITYGTSDDVDLRIDRIFVSGNSAMARVSFKGRVLGELELSITGAHNLMNAAAALATAIKLGASAQEVIAGLKLFTGARRRFEMKGSVRGVTVIDDYGHHPTELEATLKTARIFAGTGRVLTVFQPHRYSRTKAFSEGFAKSLELADYTFLLEIYPASEAPIPGVTSSLIASKMNPSKVSYEPSMPQVVEQIAKFAQPGDVIVTLGAGDVSSLGKLILAALEENR